MSLLAELKRRNVVRVGIAYIVASWLVAQVAELAADSFGAPDWFMQMLLTVLALGLPIALIFAWAFEMTPEGIKKEKDVDRTSSITPQTGRKLDRMIIGVLAVAVIYFVTDKFFLQGNQGSVVNSKATAEETETGPRSIAVLPLVNMSPDANNEYFSDGLTEELLNILAKTGELQVAGRTSSFAFKGKNEDLRSIAEKLNVETLLEGSVRKDEKRVRITLQLINAEDGYHLWSETYDRELEDIFAVQEEIALEVASAMRVTLLGEEAFNLEANARTDLNAYDLYLKGLQLSNESSHSSLPKAVEMFQQAIALDPDYLPAQLKLVSAWVKLALTGAISRADAIEKSSPVLEQVLARDPGNDEAHALKAAIMRYNRDDINARRELETALESNPRNVYALIRLGRSYHDWGETEKGMSLLRQAERIDPYSRELLWSMSFTHAVTGETDMAIAYARRLGDLEPNDPSRYWGQALAHIVNGDLAQGVYYQSGAAQSDPDDFEYRAGLANQWLAMGDLERAQKWIDTIEPEDAVQPMAMGTRVSLLQYREQYQQAADLAGRHLDLENRQFSATLIRRTWASQQYRQGNYQAALDWYAGEYPGLFESPPDYQPETPVGISQMIEIALILEAVQPGSEQVRQLLNAAEQKLNLGDGRRLKGGLLIRKAEIAAIRGQTDKAIELLNQAYEHKHRIFWRQHLVFWSTFDSLRDEPEFKQLIARFEGDADQMRDRAYELLETGP